MSLTQGFYSKFDYAEIGHFKGVLVIYGGLWQIVPKSYKNSTNPFKMTDFGILEFHMKIMCI